MDGPGRPLVAIVNDAFVARHLPGEDPVGHRISVFGLPREIVGVVRGERFQGLEAGSAPAMYLPSPRTRCRPSPWCCAPPEPLDLAPALREAVRGVDPTLALFELGTAEQALARSLEERRFTLLLLGAFAAVALTLAAVGIYGVVSFAVSERTREMGVRIALGAEPRHVFRMVVRQGLGLSFAAIAAGTVLALALGRVMERLLFGVEARDPLTFAAVAVLLLATAFAAARCPRCEPRASTPPPPCGPSSHFDRAKSSRFTTTRPLLTTRSGSRSAAGFSSGLPSTARRSAS